MAGNLVNNQGNGNAASNDVASRYRNYRSDSVYSVDQGILVLPVAGPDGTKPKVIKVHAQIGTMTREFTSAKIGAPPVIPAPTNTDDGDILLASSVDFFLPQISANQNSWVFRADGVYTYIQTNLRGSSGSVATNTFQTGDYPWTNELIDLGERGIIGGALGAINQGDRLSPNYQQFTTDYPAFFFSPDLSNS